MIERITAFKESKPYLPIFVLDEENRVIVVNVNKDENLRAACIRELCEECSSHVHVSSLEIFRSFLLTGGHGPAQMLPRDDPQCGIRLYEEVFGELPLALQQHQPQDEAKIPFASLRIAADAVGNLDDASLLGQGATCEVRKSIYLGTQVAVKRLFLVLHGNVSRDLEREIGMLTMLRHPNIITCYGSILEENRRPCVLL